MSWPTAALGELGRINTGSTPKTSDSTFWNGDIPFVTPSELGVSAPIVSAKRYLSDSGAKISRVAPANAVLVCCIGSLGKTGIAGREIVPNQQINWVEFDQSVIWPRYGYYACNRLGRQLEASSASTTLPIVNKSKFSELTISVPPLDEQMRIAAVLDKADALRRKRNQALDLLDSLGQSIFLEMFGDPVSNPKQWTRITLGDIIHKASDGPHVSPEYSESGVPFISTRHVQKGMILWEDLKFIDREQAEIHWKKCRPGRGDILYTKGGTTGLAATVETDEPFAVWVHVALLKPNFEKVEPLWLECMLNSEYCYRQSQRYTHGIANRDLGLKRMIKIEMYQPPKSEQQRFVYAAKHIGQIKKKMAQFAQDDEFLFSSLQSRAFSGQL